MGSFQGLPIFHYKDVVLRDFLDSILAFIGSETLSTEEFATVTITAQTYSLSTYNQLKTILESREMISGQLSKLANFFKAKGVSISSSSEAYTPVSNILIGKAL